VATARLAAISIPAQADGLIVQLPSDSSGHSAT
jgi:hypothetical protein